MSATRFLETLEERQLISHFGSEEKFRCDSYMIDMRSDFTNQSALLEQLCYWQGLFGHTRDRLWKGMVQVPIPTEKEEIALCMKFLDKERNNHE